MKNRVLLYGSFVLCAVCVLWFSKASAACTNPATIPSGFAAPCPVFSLSSTTVTQAQTLTLSATPQAGTDYIYTTAYVSEGTAWNPHTLSGNNAYPSYSSTLASLTLSSTQLASLSLGTHYAVVWDWLWDATAQCYKGPSLNQCNTGAWRVQSFSLTSSATPTPTPSPTPTPTPTGSTPFTGTPYPIPGTIEVENFDKGGEGVAYHDTDTVNQGGVYRTTEAVDIQDTTDIGGGYIVGWTQAGEWLNYTVNVGTAGTYTLSARVASSGQGGTFHFTLDGANLGTTFTVPNTGGWQTWTTVTQSVALSSGQHMLKLVEDTNGSTGFVGNLNWVQFTSGSYTYSQSNYYVYSQSSYYAYSQSSYTSYTYSQAAYTGGQPWTGILDSSRAVDWSNVGVVGGIPTTRTQCGTSINAYGTSTSPGSPAAINNALAGTDGRGSCSGKYVLLGPGTFYLNSGITFANINNVTLRGSGADQTRLVFYGKTGCGLLANICLSSDHTDNSHITNSATWTGTVSNIGKAAQPASAAPARALDTKTGLFNADCQQTHI